jgi:hypothetical protein
LSDFDIIFQAMKNKDESQKADKYGKVTFGEEAKLLVDIIGQNAILDLMPEKNRESYERKLQRMYKGEMPDHGFAGLQRYCEQFFKKIESNYEVSPLVMTIFERDLKFFIWDFSLYTKSNIILDETKNEIALYSLLEQAFHYIYDDSSEKDPFQILLDNGVFKTPEKNVLVFLTDSYKKVFNDIFKIFKNKEAFYNEITEPGEDYKQNIHNWRNEIVYNPNWRTLVPVLDYLRDKKRIAFVHRLIGLYLRKNAQKVFADVLDIPEDELKEIIKKTANMIREKKHPEKFPSDLYFDDLWFIGQRRKIIECLEFQNNYENSINVIKSNDILKYLECNYSRSSEEKFLYLWLQTRARVFEKYNELKDNREEREEILKGYRIAFDKLLNDTEKSPFLTQFLVEIMLINQFFNPRRVKAINDYYEYGCTLEIFNAEKMDEILNDVKGFLNPDIRKALVNIHSRFCPIKINS